ncbi:MAG: Lrp/AsnC ligand binding domain-containing protein [Chloroflexota bacterium]
MKAYVLIKVRAGEVKDVVRQLRKTDKVGEANMTFGPYDVVAVIEAPDVNKIGSMIATVIQPIPGVEQTLTCLAVEI